MRSTQRMARTLIGIALVAVCFTRAPRAARLAAPDDAADLRAIEATWLKAATTHDTATLSRLLADDFTHIAYDGRVLSKADALRTSVAPAGVRQTLSDEQVRIYADAAIVTGLNTVTSARGEVQVRLRFTDVFVRRAGRWQAVSAQETAEAKSAGDR